MAAPPVSPPPAANGQAGQRVTPPPLAETPTAEGNALDRLERRAQTLTARVVGSLEVAAAAAACTGAGGFAATLLHGRTAPFWPSAAWVATAAAVWVVVGALWWVASRRHSMGWRASAWPSLLLLPAAAAGIAVYLDDGSNHLLSMHQPAREALLTYAGVLYALGQAGFWLTALLRRSVPTALELRQAAPLLALAVGAAAYVNASLFLQWVPTQTDLLVNLRGARELLQGAIPYNDDMPVWADRVHMLPVTLLVLFGPLAQLSDAGARLLFFLLNQALWLVAMILLVRRLAPEPDRPMWMAGLLVFGATYWPWQEAIRFGQQDGLLLLLFGLSITAALRGRSVQSGIALGLVFIVKPLSIWLPLIYAIHRKWRVLFVGGATALLIVLASLPFTGWEPWWHFVRVEVPEMLPGTVRGTNIPLPSLHARLFVGRERLSDGDPAPVLGAISALTAAANVLGLLLVARLWLRRGQSRPREWLLDAGIGLTLTLLLAPMAWQHYASWLTISFLVLALPSVWRPASGALRTLSAALAGLAFLLLSLDDARLLRLLTPVVERWPAAMSFYAAGLVCLLAALLVMRLAVPAPEPFAEPAR